MEGYTADVLVAMAVGAVSYVPAFELSNREYPQVRSGHDDFVAFIEESSQARVHADVGCKYVDMSAEDTSFDVT